MQSRGEQIKGFQWFHTNKEAKWRVDSSATALQAFRNAVTNAHFLSAMLVITNGPLPEARVGETYSFSLAAMGGSTPYAWSVVAGALPEGLRLDPGGQIAGVPHRLEAARCLIRITDADGVASVREFDLEVRGVAPRILEAPQSQVVQRGVTVTFGVRATGTDPLSYLWRKNQTPILGATGSQLALTNVQAGDAGFYSVVVSNGVGAVTSSDAQLVVTAPPVLVVPVLPAVIPEEALFTLSLAVLEPKPGLRFSTTNSPAGAVMDPATGNWRWTPSEEQGPGRYVLTVAVTDADGVGDSREIELNVGEVNRPPVLAVPGDQVLEKGTALRLQLQGVDADLPGQALEYRLVEGPAGLVVSATGLVEWPADQTLVGTNRVTVQVADDFVPAAVGSATFDVVVTRNAPVHPQLRFGATPGGMVIRFDSQAGVHYRLEAAETLEPAGWQEVEIHAGTGEELAFGPFPLSQPNRFFRVRTD
jgi:hypothetical protein